MKNRREMLKEIRVISKFVRGMARHCLTCSNYHIIPLKNGNFITLSMINCRFEYKQTIVVGNRKQGRSNDF